MKNWPIYFKDRLIVSNLKSSIAIISLWTPKEFVRSKVSSESYSVLGQLYTKKGINYLIRNILANPFIRRIYIVGNDLMGSGEAFIQFMKNGINDKHEIMGDDNAGKIEEEISVNALEAFRANIEIVDIRGRDWLQKLGILIKQTKANNTKLWRKPETFSEPARIEMSSYPSEISLTKICRPTIVEAHLASLKHIHLFGLESEPVIGYVSSTSRKMKEMLNLTIVVKKEDPENWFIPDYFPFSKEDLEKYFKGFFNHDAANEDYTYGERLFNYSQREIDELKKIYPWMKIDRFQKFFSHGGFNQISGSIIKKLKGFEYDKGAIALLGNVFTDVFPSRPPRKTPCLFLIQSQIYQGKLNLTAYFRSNDMYSAWPLNAFALRKLQGNISKELKVELGSLITISNMAHVYEHDYAASEELISKHYQGVCEWDPRGNFHISTEGNEVVVKQMSPRGNEEMREWRIDANEYKASSKLCFKIIDEDLAVSVLGNVSDLSRQIERAVTAMKLGIQYKQDNPLDFSQLKK